MDKSAVIKYPTEAFPPNGLSFINGFINVDCTISFMSEIELQVWQPANPDNIIVYKNFVANAQIIRVTSAIIAETIEVRKNYRLKIADAIIVATALALDRTLIADNDSDFKKVPSLKYINPRHL
jgi:hypothetical protein